MSDIRADLERAIAALHGGDLAEVEHLCRGIVAAAPDTGAAFHLLGLVAAERGRFEDADGLLAKALAAEPKLAEAYSHRARVLHALGRIDEALALCDSALALHADDSEALNVKGGLNLAAGRFAAALESFDAALKSEPERPDVMGNRAIALLRLGRLKESFDGFERVIAIAPDYPDAWINRGNVLLEAGRVNDALASYDKAVALAGEGPEVLNYRANALKALGRFEEALAGYNRALELRPDWPEALNNASAVLCDLDRLDEALAACDRALALKPKYAEALNNRGNVLLEANRVEEALENFVAARTLRPDYAVAHVNEGLARLLLGDMPEGWAGFEWRRKIIKPLHDFSAPAWRNELNGNTPLTGKTVLFHGEQCFGDTIQFCRYAPIVAARRAQVILAVQPALVPLLKSLDRITAVVSRDEPLPKFDLHVPLLSLPRLFGTTLTTLPAAVPYLKAPDERVAKWHECLAVLPGPRIGLAWSGSRGHANDRRRSIPLDKLMPLLSSGISFVSLQKDTTEEERALLATRGIVDLGEEIADFADTAAIVSDLDQVISVDTSVAHLAGALGKPVWILLPFAPDWRWLKDRETSPWYLTARLFRQPTPGDWTSVIARVAGELTANWRAR
jgi:tetratricopeptide (TPR) repeat protein